jgi:AcrR family transcriptional regulator
MYMNDWSVNQFGRDHGPDSEQDGTRGAYAVGLARARRSARRCRRAAQAPLAAPEARRAAILDAALEEFTARGYEGARLDDVAKRAGVAKGTIYLYFADKEALFQDLVRSMVHPVLGTLEHLREVDIPARLLVEGMLNTFVREILGTRRKDIVRLIFTEGTRFRRSPNSIIAK